METTHNKASAQPLDEVLISLSKWAVDSIAYIKRRNHLSAKEKAGAIARFEQYKNYLLSLTEPISSEQLLEQQFRFNNHARYYEIPTYHLPDDINPIHNPQQLICIRVTGDIRINRVFNGDDLFCEKVRFIADLTKRDLLVLYVRLNYRTPRTIHIGRFRCVTGNTLFVQYDKAESKTGLKQGAYYSLFRVVHIYRVVSVQRDIE